MRAPDDSVSHRDGLHFVSPNELQNLFVHLVVVSHVTAIAEPALKERGFLILSEDNTNGNFSRDPVVRAVERNGCDRIAGKATIGLLPQCLRESLLQ